MKYSHDYSKLQKEEYTTIRRYSKGKIGDLVLETYPSGQHYARIIKIVKKPLAKLSTNFLISDTDLNNRLEIYSLFQSFYTKPINFTNEKFYIYYLKRQKDVSD